MLEDPGRIGESTTPEGPGSRWVTGCLGAVLLLALLVVGTVVYRHLTDETPASAHLSEAQLTGTWKSADGGVLALRRDGTFSAVRVCGFGTTVPQVGNRTRPRAVAVRRSSR